MERQCTPMIHTHSSPLAPRQPFGDPAAAPSQLNAPKAEFLPSSSDPIERPSLPTAGGVKSTGREETKQQVLASTRGYRALSLRTAVMVYIFLMGGIFYWKAFLGGANPLETALFCCAAIIIGISIMNSRIDAPEFSPSQLLEYGLTAAIAALLVFQVTQAFSTTSVIACAAIGTLAGILGHFDTIISSRNVPVAYCGAFVGMTSPLTLTHVYWIVLAGFLAGLLYAFLSNSLQGMGGKLGAIAFFAVYLAVFSTRGFTGPFLSPKVMDSHTKLAILLASSCAAPATYWLGHFRKFGPVLASSLLSLIVALTLRCMASRLTFPVDQVALAWFGASFVGMTTPSRVGDLHGLLPIKGLLFGLLWIHFKAALLGMGGILGATAFTAVGGGLGCSHLISMIRNRSHHEFRSLIWPFRAWQ